MTQAANRSLIYIFPSLKEFRGLPHVMIGSDFDQLLILIINLNHSFIGNHGPHFSAATKTSPETSAAGN